MTEKEESKIIEKFREMKKLEKERDILRKKEREVNIKVCNLQNEINDVVESNTMKF